MPVQNAASSPSLVPRLSILRVNGHVRVELFVPADLAEPLHAEFERAVDERSFELAVDAASRLIRGANTDAFWEEARRVGVVVFRTLIPEGLRPALERLRGGPLLVRTNLRAVPWEVLHDGEDFWGLSLALGKQTVATVVAAPEAAPRPTPMRPPRILLVGSDPLGDLPLVGAEIQEIYGALAGVAEVRCLNGRLATFSSVTATLAEGFDIVHYCGHIVPGGPAGPAFLLANRELLSAETFARNLAGRPILFLNGCTSGGTPTSPAGGTEDGTAIASLAEHALRARAMAVVATLRDVDDRHAATMASAFYRLLFDHVPLGEALRRARCACRPDPEASPWPGGLAFSLFGNPAQIPVPHATADHPTPEAGGESEAIPAPEVRLGPVTRRAMITGSAVTILGLFAWTVTRTRRPPGRIRPVEGSLVLWVQPFRNDQDGRRDGFGTELSDRVARRLSNLQHMTVYSAADTADLEKDGAGEIEIARILGATKTVTGTFRIEGTQLQTAVRVVDVGTGSVQPSTAVGSTDDVDAVILDLARAVADSIDILGVMLQGEGLSASPIPPLEPRAACDQMLPRIGSRIAWAAADPADIRAFLERYRTATERGDVAAIAALYEDFPPAQRAALKSYFASVRNLHVQLEVRDVGVTGDDATVSYTRTDEFEHASTGRPMRLEVNLTKKLRRGPSGWRFLPPSGAAQ